MKYHHKCPLDLKLWYDGMGNHGISRTIKKKDDNTIRYYNSNKILILQMLDTLRVLHNRYPGYEPVIIAHRGNSSNIHLTFTFSNKERAERISYNFVYSSDNEDSSTGYERVEYFSRKLSDSTEEYRYEDSCLSCSSADNKMIAAFISDSSLWRAFRLIKQQPGDDLVQMEKNGFHIVLDGPSMLEHGEGEYAFLYIPYLKKSPPAEDINVTATIDSEVYLYHTDRN